MHVVLLVEEPSMEAFLRTLLPRLLPETCGHEIHAFQCKSDLKRKLPARLRAYARWLPEDWRIFVLVDRDRDDCRDLKNELEETARGSGLRTISRDERWQLANRIVVEELEAWYFGNWEAVRRASESLAKYSEPCAVSRSGRHREYVGSVRAHPPETRLLYERTAKDGSGAGDRRARRPRGQSLPQLLRLPPHADGSHPCGSSVTVRGVATNHA